MDQQTAAKTEDSAVLGSGGRRGPLAFAGVLALFGLWSLLSYLEVVSPLLLPSPLRVLTAIKDVGFDLARHFMATVLRVLGGFGCGVLAGMAVGILMQFNRKVYTVLDGLIETFRPIPPVALIPFFILLFGFSELGKILIVTLGVALVIAVNTVEAIERVPSGVIRWGLVIGLSRKDLFMRVVLPAAWPEMRVGFRIALALAITLVVVSEFMGASYGLGYLISVSKITLTTPTILLSVILLGWLGWGLDRLLRLLFNKTSAWDIRAKGATR